jgi:hypothetical protein
MAQGLWIVFMDSGGDGSRIALDWQGALGKQEFPGDFGEISDSTAIGFRVYCGLVDLRRLPLEKKDAEI